MNLARFFRHMLLPDWWRRRVFSAADLAAITAAIRTSESRHRGELRVVVEATLPPSALWRDTSPRERAAEQFAAHRVWDTEENSGILIYLLLAEHRVEILADRGIAARVPQDEWNGICREMEAAFRGGLWRQGMLAAIKRAGDLLVTHFPARPDNPNELPDRPVVL